LQDELVLVRQKKIQELREDPWGSTIRRTLL